MTSLKGSGVDVCCVVGFPEGTARTAAKVQYIDPCLDIQEQRLSRKCREAQVALAAGAAELDMVLNVPALIAGDYFSVYADILSVRHACSGPSTSATPPPSAASDSAPPEPILKVILETSQLSELQTVAGSLLARAAGADFVKTSTGFLGRGASMDDVRVMRAVARMPWSALGVVEGPDVSQRVVKVKASGGVRTLADAVCMVEAGAERIGASASVGIVEEARASGEGSEVPIRTKS